MTETQTYNRNSEILFIYEARLCNPNGDPDDENKPRIDPRTGRNLVSDVRLKRFFRNYIMNRYGEDYIWVATVEGRHVRAEERLGGKTPEQILENCIDARLFGATIPIGKKRGESRGESLSYTGPLQFTWGYSLHPVELVDSSTITSMFVGRERTEEKGREETEEGEKESEVRYGTMGKDWRVYYSLIAFYGVASGLRSKNTGLRELDVKILDNLLWKSLALDATTRSKIGEKPHLYLRVEYNDPETIIGDLRKYIRVDYDHLKPIRDLSDIKIDLTPLKEALVSMRERIYKVYAYVSDEFKQYGLHTIIQGVADVVPLPHDIMITEESLRGGQNRA
jgi:CRISPR-associated protein Csh2